MTKIIQMASAVATIPMRTMHGTLAQVQKAAAPIQAMQSILLVIALGFVLKKSI